MKLLLSSEIIVDVIMVVVNIKRREVNDNEKDDDDNDDDDDDVDGSGEIEIVLSSSFIIWIIELTFSGSPERFGSLMPVAREPRRMSFS